MKSSVNCCTLERTDYSLQAGNNPNSFIITIIMLPKIRPMETSHGYYKTYSFQSFKGTPNLIISYGSCLKIFLFYSVLPFLLFILSLYCIVLSITLFLEFLVIS